MDEFDPYHKWLGIPKSEQPPNHYRLLGVEVFEFDVEIIEGAADRQMSFIRQYQSGTHSTKAARILNELATARLCLLRPETKKTYDTKLRATLAQSDLKATAPTFIVDNLEIDTSIGQNKPRSATRRPLKSAQWMYIAGGSGLAMAVVVLVVLMSAQPTAKLEKTRNAAIAAATTEKQTPSVVSTSQSEAKKADSVQWSGTRLITEPAGPPVDLLKNVDLERDRDRGEWAPTTTAMIAGKHGLLFLPVAGKMPDDYQLKIAARRTDGVDTLFIGFIMSGRLGILVLDGWRGEFSGLCVDRREPSDNCTTRRGPLFKDQSISNIVMTVHPGHLHVLFDGKTLIDWYGDPDRLSVHFGAYSRECPFLMTSDAKYVVESAKLIPIRPEPGYAGPKRVEHEVDVLPLVDTERDAHRGIWSLSNDVLHSPQAFGKLYLPTVVPEEYTLSADLELPANHQGPYSFGIGLVAAKSCFQFHFMDGGAIGLDMIDERRMFDNETTLGGPWLKPGKSIHVSCTVTSVGVRVEIDKTTVVNWKGNPARLGIAGDWAVPDGRRLFFGATQHFKISNVKLSPPKASRPPSHEPLSAGKPIDLLALVDPERDAIAGEWERDGKSVRVLGKTLRSKIVVPFEPPPEYKVTFRVAREAGGQSNNDAFLINLPTPDSTMMFIMDANSGAISGVSLDDGDYGHPPMTWRGPLIPGDAPQEFVCFVRRTGTTIKNGERTLFEWTGNPKRYWIRPDLQSPGGRIAFVSWNSRVRIDKLELEPTAPTSLPPALPVTADGRLLSIIRPERDARKGEWKLEGDSLTCQLYHQSRLDIPAVLSSRYVLSGKAERKQGTADLLIGLVVGGHPCSVAIDGGDGAGLDLVDGVPFWANPLHRRYSSPLLPRNQIVPFRCVVLPDTIIVECGDREVIRWHGDARRLSARQQFLPPNYSDADRNHLWLGGYHSEFIFRDLELKILSESEADRIAKSFSGVFPTSPQVNVPLRQVTKQ